MSNGTTWKAWDNPKNRSELADQQCAVGTKNGSGALVFNFLKGIEKASSLKKDFHIYDAIYSDQLGSTAKSQIVSTNDITGHTVLMQKESAKKMLDEWFKKNAGGILYGLDSGGGAQEIKKGYDSATALDYVYRKLKKHHSTHSAS